MERRPCRQRDNDSMNHMCKGGREYLQTVRHDTLKMYARRREWKMHLQGPWRVSRSFRRRF